MSPTANTITPDTSRGPEPPFRGLLRNGNPSGNPNAAPRCGAKNRAGTPCQAPAMPNGRCRCHGGKSTGPRTPEGKARSATANTRHGNTTAPSRIQRRYIRTLIKRSRLRCQARLLWPYLPPAMAARLAEGPEELWTPIHPSNLPFVQTPDPPPDTTPDRRHPAQPGAPAHPLPRALAAERAAARAEAASQAPWRDAIRFARAAKRERLAARRTYRATRRAVRAAKRAARAQAPSSASHLTAPPPQALLPAPETPWSDYTPLERELAARLAGLRARTSGPDQPASLAQNPDSKLPRINPLNPEPTAAPQNPVSAFPRINPVNPEPGPTPAQNPISALPRINSLNPELAATPGAPARAATTQQHNQPSPPSLSRPSAHQAQSTGDGPNAGDAPDGQNPPTGLSPTPNPVLTFPRIYPMNPEPTATPAPNPNSTLPRINPMNPEPPPQPCPTCLTPTKAQALGTTTLAQTWDPDLPAARRRWLHQQHHLRRPPTTGTRP